jgi:hypothetical protein
MYTGTSREDVPDVRREARLSPHERGQPYRDRRRADRGPAILPKLFRRQAAWWARKKAGMTSGAFPAYLSSPDLKKDQFHLSNEWLEDHNTARTYGRGDFIAGSTLAKEPQEIVFVEDPSTLVDSHGAPVTAW